MYDDSNEKKTLSSTYPHIAREWNYARNGGLRPEDIYPKSRLKAWWICSQGHEWQAAIYHRTSNNSGCPYCARKKVMAGVNDLKTTNPELALEWHSTKNGHLAPQDVMAGSDKRVWWVCSRGHEYEALIKSRAKMKSGCPYCSGRKAIAGINDLGTTHPEIASEWDIEKNNDVNLKDVKAGSNKKVWWKCSKCGCSWNMPIAQKVLRGHGCPNCSAGRKRYIKEVDSDSSKAITWKCEKGHERVNSAIDWTTSPACNHLKKRKKMVPHQEISPNLAAEWNYERNGTLTPADVTMKSGKKVWWKCSKGHEWQTTVYSRTAGSGCPFCSGRIAIKGENDLLTLRPDIAKLWHPTKNGDLTPEQVTIGSGKKVLWQGICGHEWLEKVITMTARKNHTDICPICRHQKKT